MAKINFELIDKKTGKSLGGFAWPVMSMTKIDESSLNKKQKKRLKKIIKNQIKISKEHFKQGAWDLDASFLLHDMIDEFFGFSITDLFLTQMCHQAKVGFSTTNKGTVYTNQTDKVFYNTVKNKLYVATKAKDVDNDIQLGDL